MSHLLDKDSEASMPSAPVVTNSITPLVTVVVVMMAAEALVEMQDGGCGLFSQSSRLRRHGNGKDAGDCKHCASQAGGAMAFDE